MKHSRGQSLIEIVVALGVAVIIATAFVTLGTVSVRNSTFSKNQLEATQLAQEGIEAMISIRDQNTPGAISGLAVTSWTQLFDTGASFPCSAADIGNFQANCVDFVLNPGDCTISVAPTPAFRQRCITRYNSDYSNAIWKIAGTPFSRKIRITDDTTNPSRVKRVTVFVWWQDGSGFHKSVISRDLHKQKLE